MNLNFGRRDRRTQEMASSLPASLFLLSVIFWQFVAAADPVPVKAQAGTDVTLPCKTSGDKAVIQAEWSRPDQNSAPVLLYKNNKVDDNQLAAYKGRTSLLNVPKGDLSLVLKKVVGTDAGKYECRAELGEGAAAGGAAAGGAAASGGAAGGGAAGGGGEGGDAGGEASGLTGGRGGGSSRASGRVLKSDPISIVILTVEGGSSHGGDGLRPKSVLPVGLLALVGLIVGLQ